MYKIENYYNNQSAICNDCLKSISNIDLKERFSKAIPAIIESSYAYKEEAENKRLYKYKANNLEVNGIKGDELISLYKHKMVPRSSTARMHYDQIMLSANNMKCPYCGVRTVTTLDHYLPKSDYPDLSILAINLIPCCKDCNFNKRSNILSDILQAYLHPYFEDVSQVDWLSVEVYEEDPIILIYNIDKKVISDTILYDRLIYEFNELQLFKLYQVYAINEISEMTHYFKEIKEKQGAKVLSKYLLEISNSIKLQKTHWRYALYKSLSDSKWFCEIYIKS